MFVYVTAGANSCYRCFDTPSYSVDADKNPKLFLLFRALMKDDNEGCTNNTGSEVEECDGDQACMLVRAGFKVTLINQGKW